MGEFFTYNGKNYGVGTIVKYIDKHGTERIKTVYRISAKTDYQKKRISLTKSVEELAAYRLDEYSADEFEKFAIVDIVGRDDTASEWAKKAEELRNSRKKEIEQNDLQRQKKHMPPKPMFSRKLLRYLVAVPSLLLLYAFFGTMGGGYINWSPFFQLVLVFDGIPLLIYWASYSKKLADYDLAQTNYPKYLEKRNREIKEAQAIAEKRRIEQQAEQVQIEAEYHRAVASQKATEPWAIKYMTSPCPHCGHYRVRYAKWEDKSLSVAFWGIASSKIGTNYKCEQCNRMW